MALYNVVPLWCLRRNSHFFGRQRTSKLHAVSCISGELIFTAEKVKIMCFILEEILKTKEFLPILPIVLIEDERGVLKRNVLAKIEILWSDARLRTESLTPKKESMLIVMGSLWFILVIKSWLITDPNWWPSEGFMPPTPSIHHGYTNLKSFIFVIRYVAFVWIESSKWML